MILARCAALVRPGGRSIQRSEVLALPGRMIEIHGDEKRPKNRPTDNVNAIGWVQGGKIDGTGNQGEMDGEPKAMPRVVVPLGQG